MRSSLSFATFPAILALASVASSQIIPNTDPQREEHWEEVCKDAKAASLTPPQLTGPLPPAALPKCNERALYYGFTSPPDYAAALQCGWYERAHPQTAVGNMFYGPGVLTMLYANGRGVPRNYDLAIRFACEDPWVSEMENVYRSGHLEVLRNQSSGQTTFDLCDDITSGLSDGFCTGIQTSRDDAFRNSNVAAAIRNLPASAKALFPALRSAQDAFNDARARNEVDLSGTSRAAFQLEEVATLNDQFLINLQRFGKGDIPPATDADLAQLDVDLNSVYKSIQWAGPDETTTITPDGIRITERAWLKLVDAWLTFSRVAYPTLSPTGVRAQLIRLRLHQLRSLSSHPDAEN